MRVLSADGQPVGAVKEVYATNFLVDRPLRHDILVPCEGIQAVTGQLVILGISADQVAAIHWDTPA
jgi:hypothetical protein